MADELDIPFEEEKPGYFARLAKRGTAMRNAILEYLPVGLISAGVMVGGASALAATGILGGVGEWIGTHMGVSTMGAGVAKVATIVGIGVVANGTMGMVKRISGDEQANANVPPRTASVQRTRGNTPELAMNQEVGEEIDFENPNKALPFNRGASQATIG